MRRLGRSSIWAVGALAVSMGLASDAASQDPVEYEIIDRVGWRAGKTDVASATETYAYDESSDTVSVTVKFDRRSFAPLPPILALAREFGFPVEFDRQVADTGKSSMFGPLHGVQDADGYVWRVKGLAKYVFLNRSAGRRDPPAALQRDLEVEVEKILKAGHLAPWMIDFKKPDGGKVNEPKKPHFLFADPGENLALLAGIVPLVRGELQQRLGGYLERERIEYPPEKIAGLPITKGTRREFFPPGDSDLLTAFRRYPGRYAFEGHSTIWALHGLSRYYEAVGGKPDPQTWATCKSLAERTASNQDWATLYWVRGSQPHYNAVQGVNRLFAGYAGYIRLARAVGDRQAEARGWGMLARMAVLRFAMGKYSQFEQKAGRFRPPVDSAWWVKERAGSWCGHLVTWNWNRPIDNVRQVHYLTEDGLQTWEWFGSFEPGNDADGQKTDPVKDFLERRRSNPLEIHPLWAPIALLFADITPELGAFLNDHLRPETEAFCARITENQPHWYIAYPDQILGREQSRGNPKNTRNHFMARAWVLREPAGRLEQYVDVPELPKVGDFFYLEKLAETIRAHRAGDPPE